MGEREGWWVGERGRDGGRTEVWWGRERDGGRTEGWWVGERGMEVGRRGGGWEREGWR